MKYIVQINKVQNHYDEYRYQYFGKDIIIKIANNSIQITMGRKTKYSESKIKEGKAIVISDSIKKAMLIHLIIYSSPLQIDSMMVMKNKVQIDILDTDPLRRIISIATANLLPINIDNWKNKQVIENILNIKSSNNDPRMAALYAFLYAKSRTYEYERFVNLWISFNGMYGYFSNIVAEVHNCDKKQFKEGDQLKYIINASNCGNDHISGGHSGKVGKAITDLLKDVRLEDITPQAVSAGTPLSDRIIQAINDVIGRSYETTAYGYLLVDYAYYFRCNLIHANKPLPLFANENDHVVACLRMVNRLLEDYINHNLCRFFDNDYIDNTLKVIARTIQI